MSQIFKKAFAGSDLSIKVHYIAGQADGAVLVTYGETVVLVTVVSARSQREGLDFLPLTVDYQEMTFAAGKIPGGFFKREGRPNEREILISRIIDRSIRPLFPKGYNFETQLIASVLSVDGEHDSDVAALLGASAALQISNIPFNGPIAGVRIGRVDGKLVANPTSMQDSDLDMFIVGRKMVPGTGGKPYDVNLVMLEGGAKELGEEDIVEAINLALESMRPVMELQDEMQKAIGKAKRAFTPPVIDEALYQKISASGDGRVQRGLRDLGEARPLRQAEGRPGEGRRDPLQGRPFAQAHRRARHREDRPRHPPGNDPVAEATHRRPRLRRDPSRSAPRSDSCPARTARPSSTGARRRPW